MSDKSSVNYSHKSLDLKREVNDILRDLSTYERAVRTYKRKFVGDLDGYLKPEAYKQAGRIFRFGVKIVGKIDEFQKSGRLEKAEKDWCQETCRSIQELSKIEGMGPVQAAEFVDAGVSSVDDLYCRTEKLTRQQMIGLKYFDDFIIKIPRKEIEEISDVIKKQLGLWNNSYSMILCGSFRRGKKTCNEVHCLLISPQADSTHADGPEVLRQIVLRLQTCGLVIETICLGKHKFSGVCRLNEKYPARLLHLRLTPVRQLPFALLYHTGPRIFVEKLMRKALEQKYSLDEYSLRRMDSYGVPGNPMQISSEEEIFEILNIPYIMPQDRKLLN